MFSLRIITTCLIFCVLVSDAVFSQEKLQSLLTVAEQSDFKSTSQSAQVVDFVKQCADSASHVSTFTFGKTVENRDMIGAVISANPYELGTQDDRIVALIIGNIHSGECAGKEAILMMIRELASNPNHEWLKNIVLVFVPNYNADANDRMGKDNRPGQLGPENGMGRRENAQNLDLNRDFIKLESPEARSLVKLIDKTNPHLFIDCHTTNGSNHQYALTYDIPHNPATANTIRSYLRQNFLPAVTEQLEQKGTNAFYYGNFDENHTTWTTYGHEPRYSTEYVGLRGRMAILAEAYSYISYRDRILATKDFVTECLNYTSENATDVRELLRTVDSELIRAAVQQPERMSVSLNARVEKFDKKFVIKGFKNDEPHDYQCDFVGNYASTRSVPLPFAYVIPEKFVRLVDRLLMHGIQVEQLATATETLVTVETIKELNRNERTFQKHQMLQAQTQRIADSRRLDKGSYVVKTAQPLGRLITYMLECESDDGFVFWNFLDEELKVDVEYPIYRIDKPVDLETKPTRQVKKNVRFSLDMIAGSNSILNVDPAPQWANNNQIRIELYGRKLLMDAKTLSFAKIVEASFDPETLSTLLTEKGLSKDNIQTLLNQEPLASDDGNWLVFDSESHDVILDARNNRIEIVGDEKSNAEIFSFSPDQTKLAYCNPEGLNVLDLETQDLITLTPENPETELLGKLDWVYQEELYGRGNYKGFWFSPDSSTIAFLKLDESNVNKFTISDHIPVRGKDEFLSYPKAGDPNPTVDVGMANISSSGGIIWTDLSNYDDQEILVSNVSWRPDSTQLVLQIQNRQQTYLDFVAVDSMSNRAEVLFRDKTPAWIESPGEPKWLADGSFLWLSPRDGFKHLYHYNPDGTLKKQITRGEWEVRNIVEFDQNNEVVYFMAAKEAAYNLDAYRLEIASGSLERLTTDAGVHSLDFNSDKSMFIDSFSSLTQPTQRKLFKSDGAFLHRLNVSSDDRWDYMGICQPEFLQIETNNGQPLDAVVIRPPNFDPNKKYPVLIHAYAGPQSPTVRNRFGRSWMIWHQILAQHGYVIWKCDNQSSSYRSAKNSWPIHRNLGSNELADIEKGVDWLKQQSWIDGDRIGIWGWSYGGYITAYAMTHSDSFKAGISGAPVTDWRNYDTIYTERLMGTPQENAEGYKSSSVVAAAENLNGNLLLIHGSIDDNVHLGNSLQFALALQKAGKQFEMMIYPENRHSVQAPEQAEHLRNLMLKFVLENL